MNILLCTKYDLVGSMMLNLILPRIAGEHSVKVILANRKRPETDSVPELGWMKLFEQDLPARLLFPLLAAQALLKQKVAPVGDQWLSFDDLSEHYGVSTINAGHIANADLLTSMVENIKPDLIVSFQFGFIFKPEALAVPQLGGLNLHSGALPQRAGVNPTFWCMKDRESHTACTLHWMNREIDSGPILEVRPMALDYDRSFFSNWMANYRNGAQMIGDAILDLAQGLVLPSMAQDVTQVRYVPTPTSDDFKVFFASGCRLIDPDDFMDVLANYLPPPDLPVIA
jgi:methionyl-tRNA formyltransferase